MPNFFNKFINKSKEYYWFINSENSFETKRLPIRLRRHFRIFGIKLNTKSRYKKNKDPNTLNIAFMVNGGFGDFLIIANYIYHFYKYIDNQQINIDIFADISREDYVNACFAEKSHIRNTFSFSDFRNQEGYDLIIKLHCHAEISYYNPRKIKKISSKLFNLLEEYKNFRDGFAPYEIAINAYHIALARGQNRVQLPDIYGLLDIKKDFDFPLPYPENESEILEKFGLKDEIFITFNRGICKQDPSAEGTKMWSLTYTNELVELLKNKYPHIKFVQLGSSRSRCKIIDNIDINLVGKTDWDDIKVLIKNSFLHIDCEGGFAHLRNALHAKHPAIVLFGPTNPDLYGYSTNINIKAENACPICCDWVTFSWQYRCLKGANVPPPCMEKISVQSVFEKVDEYINTNLRKEVIYE